MKKCVIVVDMQNDFVTGSLGTVEAQAMLPRLVARLAHEKADLIFTQDTHGADYLATQEGRNLPVPHCIKGTPGWEIVPELAELARTARVVAKVTFGSVDLPALVADYDELELVGLCTDICVISNALLLKAHYPEKTIAVTADLCAGVTPESHESALAALRMCQIAIR